ncbi:metallophosphoesterase [Neptunitalea lumnitzerae]|uniref:Phosphoesterase n=1 Tax=Neptunitalea lumnitzerae TaxID=2965509 RepID=A0ABQ5MMW3_9FLAO|nr:metallophosphoesterase [Neptunitalea sp. Y10]GLB50703.1 phosphoesterase [Neptunitalea sp. Y10]
MRLSFIVFIVLYVLIDVYIFRSLKGMGRGLLSYGYLVVSVGILGNLLIQFFVVDDGGGRVLSIPRSYAIGFFMSLLLFKVFFLVLFLGENLIRLIIGGAKKVSDSGADFAVPERRKFVKNLLLGLAAVPFASMLYGMYRGKYNYKVLSYELEFDDLPDAFDGYTITQVSDIHCGSFDNKEKISYGIDLINKQQSDLLLFTGDMVNNRADELDNWMDLFATLSAKDGKYAVLGNHDYGDYYEWNSDEEKKANLEDLKKRERDMGFDLLLNENRFIERDGQRLALLGVENWGGGHFIKVGDLDKAKENVKPDDFKILMSHDPTHWEEKVIDDPYHFHLTLSGHTHGMQFGIEIPGWIKWSPSKWRYKHWAGIYESDRQFINVNRGFGYLAFPGRVGIWPEITVIKLKKKLA